MSDPLKFSFSNMFTRTRIVLGDDVLTTLQGEYGRDRVRRVYYDQIAFVLTWKTDRVLALLVMFIMLMGLALAAIVSFASYHNWIIGSIMTIIGILDLWGMVQAGRKKMRHLAIYRTGNILRISGAMDDRKFNFFLDSLQQRIRAVQQAGTAEIQSPVA